MIISRSKIYQRYVSRCTCFPNCFILLYFLPNNLLDSYLKSFCYGDLSFQGQTGQHTQLHMRGVHINSKAQFSLGNEDENTNLTSPTPHKHRDTTLVSISTAIFLCRPANTLGNKCSENYLGLELDRHLLIFYIFCCIPSFQRQVYKRIRTNT